MQDLNLPKAASTTRASPPASNVLEAVNDHFAQAEKGDGLAAMDTFYQRAYSLISSPARPAKRSTSAPSPPPSATSTGATPPASAC